LRCKKRKVSIFPIFQGIFGIFRIISHFVFISWFPAEPLKMFYETPVGKCWPGRTEENYEYLSQDSRTPGWDLSPSPEYKAGIVLAITRNSVVEFNDLLSNTHVSYEVARRAYVVNGYSFGMVGRDPFQDIRLERNRSHEQRYSPYPVNRLASNCVPYEYKPSALPRHEFALFPLPIHCTISYMTSLTTSGANIKIRFVSPTYEV
jgi:hypothetical protein